MGRMLKSGPGWQIGWDPEAVEFQGLIGTDEWAIELTQIELDDFCRLALELSDTMWAMRGKLMDEEAISLEAESDCLWLEAEGYPDAYSMRFILQSGRRAEGMWSADMVPGLLAAMRSLKVW